MQVLRPKALKAWNMLFDEHNLDAILVPGFMHTPTMACGAAKTCAHRVLDLETGVIDTVANFSSLDGFDQCLEFDVHANLHAMHAGMWDCSVDVSQVRRARPCASRARARALRRAC